MLRVGNFLNDRAPRAKGFRFESLLKMADTKAFDGHAYTLLHFVCESLGDGAAARLAAELEHVPAADKTPLDLTLSDLRAVRVGHNVMAEEILQLTVELPIAGDRFKEEMGAFSVRALARLESMEDQLAMVRQGMAVTVAYFGDEDVAVSDLLQTAKSLLDLVRRAEEENAERRARLDVARRRATVV